MGIFAFPIFGLLQLLLHIMAWTGQATAGNLTLTNSAPTNWGYWGKWEYCPAGTFAAGFQLKVQGRQWSGDDTALNAVKLFCVDIFNPKSPKMAIMSSEGNFGEWGYTYNCDGGFLTGFQLRSEGDLGDGDDTAANNLRVICSNPAVGTIEGDGMRWGSWGSEEKCMERQAICGLQTQVSWNLGQFADNVALNNVKMQCCDIPFDLRSCEPKDEWVQVVECDNLASTSTYPLQCKMEKEIGLSPTPEFKNVLVMMEQLGFSPESSGSILEAVFKAKLKTSTKTGHNWEDEPSESWKKSTSTHKEFPVAAGKLAHVHQVVGSCGPMLVHTNQFKKEESDDPF